MTRRLATFAFWTAFALVCVSTSALAATSSSRQATFTNTEPFAANQWYLDLDRAWSYWPARPKLAPVKVAVIDTGIDLTHPEFHGVKVTGKSFVGGSWSTDTVGHGTFVAGEIAANSHNHTGIAGMAFNAQLLVAKVEKHNEITFVNEAAGIRWAADQGARVINLSVSGTRDPQDTEFDHFSQLEQNAIAYAYAKGALVVAAVGNGPESPSTPWPYAGYPSALPHVIGVSAIDEHGAIPIFSNRDDVYNDVTAPGSHIFSTIPSAMINSADPLCSGVAYSSCGPSVLRAGDGTSFSAPQVSAAAALLLGVDPALTPDQLSWLLERSALDENPATGCKQCPAGRDRFAGWGRLDVQAALELLNHPKALPKPDRYEPNDGPGTAAFRVSPTAKLTASVDYWDDRNDVYAVTLPARGRLSITLTHAKGQTLELSLWRPGTPDRHGTSALPLRDRLANIQGGGTTQTIGYRAGAAGTYYLQVSAAAKTQRPIRYQLTL